MPGHHPSSHARLTPDRLAMVLADTGETLTYRELDEGSNRVAQLLRAQGLRPGDRIALMMRNSLDFAIVYWGATRCGCFPTLLSTHLKPGEASFILGDSGARTLILSAELGETPEALAARGNELCPAVESTFFIGDRPLAGARSLTAALAEMPAEPVSDEISGYHLMYSSGTTGKPKGIVVPFTPGAIDEFNPLEGNMPWYDGLDPLMTLNAGPLYHAAPISSMIVAHRRGGTFLTQRKFDAEGILRAIEQWRINAAQFVPTMFVRMLALPEEVRRQYDLSSLRFVLHSAAPCPVEIKRRMIEWWGPILYEYYSSSEGIGATGLTSQEWLERPGSVGKSFTGAIHVCGEDGAELPAGEAGLIYFEALPGRDLNYLNDPEKTERARHPLHKNWLCVGDIGKVDEEGYLYLTDRKDFMIISGGVNIYPQAVEDCLIVHPKVLDAAVIGVPDAEYGEAVKAIVQPRDWADAGDDLERDLRDWVSTRISKVTWPRSYEFVEELPRLLSGKLAKHELRKQFGDRSTVTAT